MTTTDAGMAVPDWPTTYGYNLFLYPWQTWLFGPWDLFIEHGHRLLGAAVGILAIGLVAVTWLCDRRGGMRWAAVGALALVVVQGVLGGARVLLDERLVALIHGCIGPLFFAYAASLAVFTSRSWQSVTPRADAGGKRLARAAWALTALAYVQLVFGAVLRHPLLDAPPMFYRAVLILHVIAAVVLVIQAAMFQLASLRSVPGSRGISLAVAVLILVQIALGAATYVAKYNWPAWMESLDFAARFVVQERSAAQSLIVTGHAANGSLIVALAAVQAWLLSRRFFRAGWVAASYELRFVRAVA